MAIHCNSDMPKCLNTPTKQAKKARQLAEAYSNTRSKRARGPRIQGCFSRTMIVELVTGVEVVIQFRPEPLDLEVFVVARAAFGPIVPEIVLLADEEMKEVGIWPYWMTRMPGQTWLDARVDENPERHVTATRSLGRILAKGRLPNGDTESVIEHTLRPHLQVIATSDDEQVSRFRGTAKHFLEKLDTLKTLPLFVSHFDLNGVNIMVRDGEISGLLDWELSTPLPFGMGFARIHTLAGEFSERKFCMPPEFEDAERGFWQEIYDGADVHVRKILDSTPEKVELAIRIGSICNAFQLEHGKLTGCNPVVLDALEKFLSYRLPFTRGSGQPYSF